MRDDTRMFNELTPTMVGCFSVAGLLDGSFSGILATAQHAHGHCQKFQGLSLFPVLGNPRLSLIWLSPVLPLLSLQWPRVCFTLVCP